MPIKARTAALMLCTLLMAACGKQPAGQAQGKPAAAPPAEATAWWKTEGQPGGAAAAAKLTGAPLPDWKQVDSALASKGKELFAADCASCHTFGKGAAAGPDLQGVTHRDSAQWSAKFISAPENLVKSDPHAQELMNKYLVQMPNFHLSADQIQAINAYLRQQDETAAKAK
ncbi:MAG TPA: cytochrome c [Geomonas sp.]|nr:cytochrome c [Geomonas sp.]